MLQHRVGKFFHWYGQSQEGRDPDFVSAFRELAFTLSACIARFGTIEMYHTMGACYSLQLKRWLNDVRG